MMESCYCEKELSTEIFCKMVFVEVLCGLLYTYLHSRVGVDNASGYSWQLITAYCNESDGLTFVSNSQKVMLALVIMLPSNCCEDFSIIV